MAVSVLGPVFTAIEAGVGAAIPGELGGLVATGLEGAITGAGTGAAIGGLESAITGQPIGKGIEQGALGGGLTGGAVGALGPVVSDATGMSGTLSNALVGGGTGVLTSGLTGQSPAMAALSGGLSGALSGAGVPGRTPAGSAGSAGSGTAGRAAVATAAPAGLPASPPGVTDVHALSDAAPFDSGNDFSGISTPGSDTFGGQGLGAAAPGAGGGGGGGRVSQGFDATTGGDIGSTTNDFSGVYTPGSDTFGGQNIGGGASPSSGGSSYPSGLPIDAPAVGNVNYNDALAAAQQSFNDASLATFSPFSGSNRFLADFGGPDSAGSMSLLRGPTELASVPTAPTAAVAAAGPSGEFADEFADPYKTVDLSKAPALQAFGLTGAPSATEALSGASPGSLTPRGDANAAALSRGGILSPTLDTTAELTTYAPSDQLFAAADPNAPSLVADTAATPVPTTEVRGDAGTSGVTRAFGIPGAGPGLGSDQLDFTPHVPDAGSAAAVAATPDATGDVGAALQSIPDAFGATTGGFSAPPAVAATPVSPLSDASPLSPTGNVDPASPTGQALQGVLSGSETLAAPIPPASAAPLSFAPDATQTPAAAAAASEAGAITPTVAGAPGATIGDAAPTAGAAPVSSGGFLSSVFKSPAALLAGGGLALDVLRGNQTPGGYNQILGQANQAAQRGKQLQDYLNSGTLPPGIQASLNSARSDAEAAVRSQYASRGMSGSSAEAQDLQAVNQRVASQGADMAMKLFQMGMSESEISSQLYQVIMQEQIQQDQELSQGISNMVTALAGMSRPLAA